VSFFGSDLPKKKRGEKTRAETQTRNDSREVTRVARKLTCQGGFLRSGTPDFDAAAIGLGRTRVRRECERR
jgi:hypothetical protein